MNSLKIAVVLSALAVAVFSPLSSYADFAGREGQYLDNKGGMIYDIDAIDYSIPGRVVLSLASGGEKVSPVAVIVRADKVAVVKQLIADGNWIGCKNASPGEICQFGDGFLSQGFGVDVRQVSVKDL